MAGCLFTCPVTDLKVQHWLDDDEDVPENEHEAITCEACARLHLINQGLADFWDRRISRQLANRIIIDLPQSSLCRQT